MRKLSVLILLLCISSSLISQISEETKKKYNLSADIITDFWQDLPDEFETKSINPGANLNFLYLSPIAKSNFYFCPGLAIGAHNLRSDFFLTKNNDSTFFVKIPDTLDVKKNKLTTVYLDIPVEIRYKSKGKFMIAIGFKYGFLINSHTKYKGEGYDPLTRNPYIEKIYRIADLEKNRYGFTFRVGYDWFNLFGYYSISKLFKESKGPEMYPISAGITISPK